MRLLPATFLIGISIAGLSQASFAQDTPETAAGGIFAAEQAADAMALYESRCAECHGDNLTGTAMAPPLTGFPFVSYWDERSVFELYDYTLQYMPAARPGSLNPEQAANLTALILSENGYPSGDSELLPDAEVLSAIVVGTPPEAM